MNTAARTPTTDPLNSAFAMLTGEDMTERACKAIPYSQCTSIPWNFVLNVANGACTKLAEQLASPTLVLPWLIAAIGGPVAVVGWFVPVKQAGSLLPQLAAAAYVRGLSQRKWGWAGAGAVQAVCLALMAFVVAAAPVDLAAWAMLGLFAVFSVASGVGSVAFQDVTGKTIDKGLRGRMLAGRATAGGALTLVAAAVLKVWVGGDAPAAVYVALIGVAACLWLVGALLFAAMAEEPGATEGGRNMVAEVRAGMTMLTSDGGFRRFMAMRVALVIGIDMAPPFFVLLAQQRADGSVADLGILMFAVGFANVISSRVWGGMADRSAKKVCQVAGAVGAVAAVAALVAGLWVPGDWAVWAFAGVFVVSGVGEAGARLGRKTYLVDVAPKDERPLYTALSNTLAGIAALLAGTIGLAVPVLGVEIVIATLAILALAGALAAAVMPEPADD